MNHSIFYNGLKVTQRSSLKLQTIFNATVKLLKFHLSGLAILKTLDSGKNFIYNFVIISIAIYTMLQLFIISFTIMENNQLLFNHCDNPV